MGNPKGWKSEIQKYRAEVRVQRKAKETRRREFLAAVFAAVEVVRLFLDDFGRRVSERQVKG